MDSTLLSLRHRLLACWLMLALVLSPALGLVHQVVHTPGLAPHVVQPAGGDIAQPAAKQALDAIHALFAGHSKAECVLLDQMALGHALLAKALPLLQVVPAAVPVALIASEWGAQHASPFQARGPPRLLSEAAAH